MSNTKAITDFSGYTAANLAPAATTIVNKLFGNANFPTPPFMQGDLQTKIAAYLTAEGKKASRATQDFIDFNIVRHELEDMLSELGGYVNDKAKGDLAIVSASGFPYYDTARQVNTAPPAAPTGLVLRHGDLTTTVVARYHPDRASSINELQTTTGDPSVDANFTHAGMFSGGKATLSGFTVGSTIWVRVRTVGLKGVMGSWSDPVKITVI